jgi:hypothetical protein
MDRRYETIAPDGHGDDKPGSIGVIIQGPADFADSGADAVFAIDENAFAPDPFEDFLAGYKLTATLNQKTK